MKLRQREKLLWFSLSEPKVFMTHSHLGLWLCIYLLGPGRRQFRPDFQRCWAITASMQAKGNCDQVELCWMWLLFSWREHAQEAISTVFTSCLHSGSKFIANRDLNCSCVIYSRYEISKGSKQMFYIINIYQKEIPGLLNPSVLLEFLACCLNV